MKILERFTDQNGKWEQYIQQIDNYLFAASDKFAIRKKHKGEKVKKISSYKTISDEHSETLIKLFNYEVTDKIIINNCDIVKAKPEKYLIDKYNCKACDSNGNVEYIFEYDLEEYTKLSDCPICNGLSYIEPQYLLYIFNLYTWFKYIYNLARLFKPGTQITLYKTNNNHIIKGIIENYEFIVSNISSRNPQAQNPQAHIIKI